MEVAGKIGRKRFAGPAWGLLLLAAFHASARAGDIAPAGPTTVALDDRPALQLETVRTIAVDRGTAGVADRGDMISYLYAVTNTGTVTVRDVVIDATNAATDGAEAIGSETLISDVPPFNDLSDETANDGKWSALAPGDTVIFAQRYVVTQADIDRQ